MSKVTIETGAEFESNEQNGNASILGKNPDGKETEVGDVWDRDRIQTRGKPWEPPKVTRN